MINKLIESAEQEIAVCELRLEFLQNEESKKKGGRAIMDAMIQVTAQKRVAGEWLEFLKSKKIITPNAKK